MEQAEVLADSGDLEPGGGGKKDLTATPTFFLFTLWKENRWEYLPASSQCAPTLSVRARLPCVCIFILPACMRPPARSAVCDGASALVTAVVVYLCSAYKFISFPFNTAPPDPRSRRRQQQQQLCYHGDRGRKED